MSVTEGSNFSAKQACKQKNTCYFNLQQLSHIML